MCQNYPRIINEVLIDVFPKTNTSDKSCSTIYYNKLVESKSKFNNKPN